MALIVLSSTLTSQVILVDHFPDFPMQNRCPLELSPNQFSSGLLSSTQSSAENFGLGLQNRVTFFDKTQGGGGSL
jgi:hypothetical protein